MIHKIRSGSLTAILAVLMARSLTPAIAEPAGVQTFCNPIDLPYSFGKSGVSCREAADPTMILYKGEYWLFASKSEGYWHSKDFAHWSFIAPTGLPIDNYAPTVLAIGDRLYWTACGAGIYGTDDPVTGDWTKVSDTQNEGDPALFRDDDGRVYLYSGLNDGGPIGGQELDPSDNLKPLSGRKTFFGSDIAHHGAEISAEPDALPPYNPRQSWIEGSWMTKHGGKYYLQYSAPGTQYKTYNDGVYVGDHPLGPFTYAPYSPFSSKPGGFAGGAGHSSTFQDFGGRYWHIATMTISMRQMFERRLGVFPAWFERDGQMVCNTYLGDYPQYLPGRVKDNSRGASPGWMLVSYKKAATASSALDGHPAENAFNEDIRTWWSAKTGDPGEWLQTDLGKRCRVNAIQINFADEGATQVGRLHDGYGYKLDLSDDGKTWKTAVHRSAGMRDAPHDYIELTRPVFGRYVRITNTHTPAGAKFSISGLRLFGSGLAKPPARPANVRVTRDAADPRQATITWDPAKGSDGYIVRYGIDKDRLFTNYQVYDAAALHIHTLNVGTPYYFTVDSFNDTGVTKGTETMRG